MTRKTDKGEQQFMAERKKTVQSTRRSNSAPKKGNNSRKTTAMPKKRLRTRKGKVGRPRKTDYQKPERIENPGNEGFSVWEEILVWLVLALSVLILIGNFGVGGFIGNTVSHISLGAFGLMAYLFPFAFSGSGFCSCKQGKKHYVGQTGRMLSDVACHVHFLRTDQRIR